MTDDKPDKKKPRPRHSGGKTKRGPNKWLLRIFRVYDAGGKRIYFSEIFHGGSRDADKRLTELHNRHRKMQTIDMGAFCDGYHWIE